ncbi:MAG TPA: DNA repair protein RadA [Candidatus Saccharimonadales bacterium]|nr:DNA repair protein RadA [Candidatus Saccharimonadales bacterium]
MAAKKQTSRFVCSNCGAQHSAWAGRCSVCGEWNTIQEEPGLVSVGGSAGSGDVLKTIEAKNAKSKETSSRISSGIKDFDNVLGGGFVRGGICLTAGQPGIGKSTLLLQAAANIAKNNSVLYVSGEESAHQIALRANRLGVDNSKLALATSTSADDIAVTISSKDYDVVFVDSIQTMTVGAVASSAGSVSQITNSTHLIMNAAKRANTAVVLVGHVTKEGSIAGPKILEHVVDVVLNLEGDRYGGFKLLRSVKNRFGSTNEAGIFEMKNEGLVQVENPSASLLAERQESDGSVVLATMEGMRPVLVEVQALVNKTSYGYPKRAASGIDLNRVNLLVAMLERRTKLNLADQDIYINIVGGIRISEPAADLAICMAIGSAAKGLQLKGNAVVFGEVGLSGEVRRVNFGDKRIAEAKKLGFDTVIGPKLTGKADKILKPVTNIKEALNTYLKK